MGKYPDIIQLYAEEGEFWLKERAKSVFSEKKYLEWMVENLQVSAEILDLGCGDGWPIASYVIDCGMRVTGVDGAPGMIEKARLRFPSHLWLLGDMRTIDLKKKFHAIIAWDSFFHLSREDQTRMFAVFQRHLYPGGLLLFTSGPGNGEAIGVLNGKPLYHASLSPNEYRSLFAKHSLEEVAFNSEDKDCGGHTVWRCRLAKSSP